MTTLSVSIRRYRLLFLLAALSVLALTVLATNTAAWTSEDLDPAENEYRSAFVYYAGGQYWRGESVMPSYTAMGISGNYRGYMSYPVSHLDDNAYIESATMTIIARNSGSFTLNVRVMDRELHELDPELTFSIIYKGTSAGTVSISTGLAYRSYSRDITGAALEELREVVAGEDDYLVIAFDHSSLGWVDLYARYIDLSGTHYTTLTLEYDNEAPDVPTPTAQQPYVTGDHVPITWSPATDNPSGGNRGDVTYQVGVYLPGAPADNPYHTGPWVDATSWNFTGAVEGIEYTFRVRARDGSGFTSSWSAPVNTMIDNSPPSIPYMHPLPRYTGGDAQHLFWDASIDLGVGGVTYHFQLSLHSGFNETVTTTFNSSETRITLISLDVFQPYYYRVRAIDTFGHTSTWSNPVWSVQDYSPPSVPVMFEEPEFTSGDHNVFEWHPSRDDGVGVYGYVYQITNNPAFPDGTLTVDTCSTRMSSGDLEDGITHYWRVKAVDMFGYGSDWSEPVHSTQDASPPSAPFIHPLPDHVPEGPVTISWSPAIDHGVGVSHYEVWWTREGIGDGMVVSFTVFGQSLTIPDLIEGTWTFGIVAVDRFGHYGPWAGVNTTIDGTPPTRPVLEELPEFSKGTSTTLRWNRSTDDSGIDHYRVFWRQSTNYASERYIDTLETEVTLVDLTEGVLYWYQVYAYDKVGNRASSLSESSTQDASPPPAPYLHHQSEIQKRDSTVIEWSPVTDNNGMAVEYQLSGTVIDFSGVAPIEFPWTSDLNQTIGGLSELAFYRLHVVARDSLGWISEPSNEVSFGVDLTPPVVEIWTPTEGQVITGTFMIHGQFKDVHPNVYFIEYRSTSQEEWISIVYWTENVNPPNFYERWDTTGLPDGDYVIRVTHVDDIGWQGYDEVNVTLANAHPTVSPTDIGFAVPAMPEGATKVMVAVRNDGDSMARNLTVKFFVDMQVMKTRTGVDVEAHSYEVFFFVLNKTGKRYVEVSVGSDLYDTQSGGRFLETEEPEVEVVAEDDTAMALGILALVLGVIALLISVLVARRLPAEVPE